MNNIEYLPTIVTNDGNVFDFLNPSNNAYDIEVIAHALSRAARFAGHTHDFYSVAEHSVRVSRIVSPRYRLQALLHDATEAFTGDLVKPKE